MIDVFFSFWNQNYTFRDVMPQMMVLFVCQWEPNFLWIRPKAPLKVWQDPLIRFIFMKINEKICLSMEIKINFVCRYLLKVVKLLKLFMPIALHFKKTMLNAFYQGMFYAYCLIKFEQVVLDQNLFLTFVITIYLSFDEEWGSLFETEFSFFKNT